MRTLDEKDMAVLTLLAADSKFKAQAFAFLKNRSEALAVARVLVGETSDDPDVQEAAETIRSWAQQQRVPAGAAVAA